MSNKEFVLVSQGIEIMRTKSQEKAINIVKKENDEYFDYQQKCYDNYERPADNYIDLEIEYSDEKDKDKEIERLNNKNEELLTLYTTERKVKDYYKNIINELEKWLEEQHQFIIEIPAYTKEISIEHKTMEICYENILDKLQELKGVDKNDKS